MKKKLQVTSYKLQVARCEQPPRLQLATNNLQLAPLRTAFTMIELLVVIGIILILMGLFFAGAKLVTAQARERDTKTMLETCKTMFENYRQATKLYINPATNYPKGSSIDALSAAGATGSLIWSTGQEQAPGLTSPGAPDDNMPPNLDPSLKIYNPNEPYVAYSTALKNTLVIMQAMLTIHENQTILNNLPASKVLKDPKTGVPLLLDAWGNVIIFVPGGGLTGVFVDPADNGGLTQVITSEQVQPNGWTPPSAVANPYKPFFVSAGPDGDMSNAHGNTWATATSSQQSLMTDDNIYSFQN